MQHLDEGTIHAWLDGAVSVEEGHAIEAHVAGCGACAELVAEARGLIAGSSRILTALDHVPGGVIPAGAPAAPIPARGGVRRWASRPGLRVAAAVLFLAGASVVVLSNMEVNDVGLVPAMDAAREGAAADEAAAPSAATTVVPTEAMPEAAASNAAAEERAAAPASTGAIGAVGGGTGAINPPSAEPPPSRQGLEPGGAQAKTTAAAITTATPAPPPAPAPVPAAGQVAGRAPGQRDLVGGVGRAAVGVAADSTRQQRVLMDSIAVASAARSRIAADSPLRLSEITTTGASAFVRDSAAEQRMRAAGQMRLQEVVTGAEAQPARLEPSFAGRPGVEMAGCYSVAVGRWSELGGAAGAAAARVPPAIPPLLRLEATTLDIARDGPRLVLRTPSDTAAARADSSYWRVSARDSLLIVWRGATPEVSLRLAIRDPMLEGVARQGDRTAPATATRMGAACEQREQGEPAR